MVSIYQGISDAGDLLVSAADAAINDTHTLSASSRSITFTYTPSGPANLAHLCFDLVVSEDTPSLPISRNIDQLVVFSKNRFPRSIAFRSTEYSLAGGIYVVDEKLENVLGTVTCGDYGGSVH